jgi:hypothetical protein
VSTESALPSEGQPGRRWRRTVLVAGLVILMLALDLVITYQGLTSRLPGANDFYVPWRAAQLWLQEGLDPYGRETTLQIQLGLFGRPQPPGEHQYAFAYPLYALFPILPLTWLSYAWAEAMWLTGLQVTAVATALLALRIYHWRPMPLFLAGWVLWFLAFYPTTRALFLGQWALPVAALLAACLWALRKDRDGWAGVLLALTTVKPQMIVLILPWLLWWVTWKRRWRVWFGFGGTWAILMSISLLLMPDWPLRFLWGLGEYGHYTAIGSPLRIIGDLIWPTRARLIETVGMLLLGGYVILNAWRLRQAKGQAVDWLTGLTFAVTSLVAPRTATTNQVALVLPLAFALQSLPTRRRSLWMVAILVLLLIVPWFVFLATVKGREEQPIAYVPLPLIFTAWFIVAHRRLERKRP